MSASPKLIRTKVAGVYRRGDGYVVRYRDLSGRGRKKCARTFKEAVRLRAELTADVARGEYRATTRLTFVDYAPHWIASYRGRTGRGIGPDTLADYRRTLGLDADGKPTGTGAVAFFGRMRLAEIGPPELRAYADTLAKRGLARDTIRLYLAPLKCLLATAHEDGLIRSNPASGLRNLLPANLDRDEARAVKALDAAELAALLAALPDEWRPFFSFLAESGLRIGEAVELRWRDVDLGGGWLTVERRFYRGRVALPKGRKSRRIRLSERTARSLWALRKQTRSGADDLVWTAEKGGRVDQSNLMSRVLKPAGIAAGVGDWLGFHAFRHTCATMLFRAGWNAAQVQRYLGHSDPGFTLRRYVHLLDDDLPTPSVLESLASPSSPGRADSRTPSAVAS
jgi:integrase